MLVQVQGGVIGDVGPAGPVCGVGKANLAAIARVTEGCVARLGKGGGLG